MTVDEVVRAYLAHAARSYAPRSLAERRRILGRFVADFGPRASGALTPADLILWLDKQATWKSDWTRRHAATIVCRPFNWAARLRLIPDNPLWGATCGEGEPRRAVTAQEFRRLVRRADRPFRRLLWFLRLTGCRPGEASRLTWADVDWAAGVCTLAEHKTRRKTRRPRLIVLTAAALAVLRCQARYSLAPGPIFVTADGTAWQRTTLGQKFARLRRRCKLPAAVQLYGLRHLFATAAVAGGASVKLVAQALGHASTATAERYYVHVAGEVEAMRREIGRGR